MPLYQNESTCEIVSTTGLVMQIKHKRFCTKSRFEIEAQGNSEWPYSTNSEGKNQFSHFLDAIKFEVITC